MSILNLLLDKLIENNLNLTNEKLISYLINSKINENNLNLFQKVFLNIINTHHLYNNSNNSKINKINQKNKDEIISLLINNLTLKFYYISLIKIQTEKIKEIQLINNNLNSTTSTTSLNFNNNLNYLHLLQHEKNIKNSLLILYEVRSHEIIRNSQLYIDRVTTYNRKYRVNISY